jgi:hypothetical protein
VLVQLLLLVAAALLRWVLPHLETPQARVVREQVLQLLAVQ